MRALIILVLVLIGIAAYPLLNEDANNECSALEKRFVGLATKTDASSSPLNLIFGNALTNLSNGSFVAPLIKERYPNLPPQVGCGLVYYQSIDDPSWVTDGTDTGSSRVGIRTR